VSHRLCLSTWSDPVHIFEITGRQLVLFELARVCQYFMIDLLVLHTRFVSRTLGPWVTIFCLQSKGWPFVVGSWGLWALLLLQGNSKFDYHWLYFSGIQIYSSGNSGSYVISSEAYLRVLLAMVIVGAFAALKRTLSTLYFGRRMFGRSQFQFLLTMVVYRPNEFLLHGRRQMHTNQDSKKFSMTSS
jgi:hypothetical protein